MVDEKTPKSKERKGRWLGLSHHVGDKLTYHVYCEDTLRVVSRSVIRIVDPFQGAIPNQQLDPPEESFIQDSIKDSGEFGSIKSKTSSFKHSKPGGTNNKDVGESSQNKDTGEDKFTSGEPHSSSQEPGEANINSPSKDPGHHSQHISIF